MFLKKIQLFIILLFSILFFKVDAAHTIETSDIEKSRTFLISFLKEANAIAKKINEKKALQTDFSTLILAKFSMDDISSFILGPYKRELSNSEKKEFEKTLSAYFLKSFGTKEKIDLFASTDVSGKQIETTPVINKRKTRITYTGEFKTAQGKFVTNFVLIKKDDNTFKVFDIKIENISLVITMKAQVKALQEKSKNPKTFLKVFKEKSL